MKNTIYISILNDHMNARKSRNPSYGLRSFARDLDISPASLSLILNGKQRLSPARSQIIATKLNLNSKESEIFTLDVTSAAARKKKDREVAKEKLDKLLKQNLWLSLKNPLEKVLRNWEYMAIFDLIKARKQTSLSFLKQYFNFPSQKIESALTVLVENELIEQEKGGYISKYNKNRIDSPIPSRVIQSFHHQVLDQVKSSIDELGLKDREITSTFLTVEDSSLAELKKEIEDFRVMICDKYGVSQSGNKLTTIGISLNFFKIGEEK